MTQVAQGQKRERILQACQGKTFPGIKSLRPSVNVMTQADVCTFAYTSMPTHQITVVVSSAPRRECIMSGGWYPRLLLALLTHRATRKRPRGVRPLRARLSEAEENQQDGSDESVVA
ncbi:hypothetical protein Bbelb_396500 [Branchiostoma belcheri]|nr:hypothetical protein Bbelb_396500 [Branchiostoma belcheri]